MAEAPVQGLEPTPSYLRGPLILLGIATSVALIGVGLWAAFGAGQPNKEWQQALVVVHLAAGGGLAAVGAAFLLFKIATHKSVEWFLAWRYLRVRGRGSRVTLKVGLWICAVAALFLGAALLFQHTDALSSIYAWINQLTDGKVRLPGSAELIRGLQATALGLAMLGYLVTFFGVLLLNFSLFASISVFGVFLGTAALVIVLSVMGGFEHDLRQKILGTTAHVTVVRHRSAFTGYRKVVKKVAAMKSVKAVMPYLEGEVMITSQTNLSGVLLKGVDPKRIGKVTDLHRYLKAGGGKRGLEFLQHPERLAKLPRNRFRPMVTDPLGRKPDEPGQRKQPKQQPKPGAEPKVDTSLWDDTEEHGDDDDDDDEARTVYPGVIIGAELAKNLRLVVGEDVNMVAPLGGMSPAGPIPKSKPFRVAGIFYSGMYEYDTKFAYVTIPAAQRFLGLDDVISGVEIKVRKLEDATPLAEQIRAALGSKRYDVEDWKQRNSGLFSALKLERVVMFIVLTFIVIVASLCIIITLIMVVLEKTREIAALKAMGAANNNVLKIFLYCGLYIGTIGMMVGVLTGVGIGLFLAYVGLPLDPEVYYISELPVKMSVRDILIIAGAAELIAFLATLYPAYMAANLRPVDGLRRYVG